MSKRPGRTPKPETARFLNPKLDFGDAETAQAVRDKGGGRFIKQAVLTALDRLPAERPVTTDVAVSQGAVELHVKIPLERLRQPADG